MLWPTEIAQFMASTLSQDRWILQETLGQQLALDTAYDARHAFISGYDRVHSPTSVTLPAESMTHQNSTSLPRGNQTPAEVADALDEWLFNGSSLLRGAALRGTPSKGPSENPGYPVKLWNYAERRAKELPAVDAGDLIAAAYEKCLGKIARGGSAENWQSFFTTVVKNLASSLWNHEFEVSGAETSEIRRLEAQNNPLLREEIERRKNANERRFTSWDDFDYKAANEKGDVVDEDGEGGLEAKREVDLGSVEELLNRLRLCFEECAHGMEDLSAVLTWTTLGFDTDINLDDVPKQTSGRHADQWQRWPSLWFASQNKNLLKGGGNHATRRSREFKKIDGLKSRAERLMRTSGTIA